MKNKVLVQLQVPELDETYDIFLPINVKIGTVLDLINKSLNEMTSGTFVINNTRKLYNAGDSIPYKIDDLLRNTNIRNGSVIVLL